MPQPTNRWSDFWSAENIEKLRAQGCGTINCRSRFHKKLIFTRVAAEPDRQGLGQVQAGRKSV